jgi:hypothetical protein
MSVTPLCNIQDINNDHDPSQLDSVFGNNQSPDVKHSDYDIDDEDVYVMHARGLYPYKVWKPKNGTGICRMTTTWSVDNTEDYYDVYPEVKNHIYNDGPDLNMEDIYSSLVDSEEKDESKNFLEETQKNKYEIEMGVSDN